MRFWLISYMLFCIFSMQAQVGLDILEGPVAVVPCNNNCDTLHANFPKPLKTNQYSVSAISYNPVSISGTQVNLADDTFSGAIPLGFDFCFFQSQYSQCYLADNGVLTFSPLYNLSACNNNTQQTLPYYNSTFPDNAIFFLFMDVNPALGGTIEYATVGVAPFRKFVAQYSNLKIFGSTCSNTTSTFQVVLYESTHVIDVFIQNKTTCDNDPLNYANYATVGIQNVAATTAYTAPGKHAAQFTANNEGIRFSPSGLPDYVMKWYGPSGNVLATNVDSLVVCPTTYPYKIKAEIVINCPNLTFSDTVRLEKIKPKIDSIVKIKPLCSGDSSGSLTVYASGVNAPFTYSIANGSYTTNNTFSNLPASSYLLSVLDAAGCKKDTIVSLPATYVLNFQIDSLKLPTCPNNNGYISGHPTNGTAPYSITWSNGDTGPVCDSFGTGTLIVTVVDANGCTNILPITIIYDSLPTLNAVLIKPVCHDSTGSITLNVTGGQAPYTYSWSGGQTGNAIQNLSAGFYTVTVVDFSGCSKTGFFSLTDTLVTNNLKDSVATTCGLANGQAVVYPFNGASPYSFQWFPSVQTSNPAINLAPGFHTCQITDANGCLKIDSMFVDSSLAMVNLISKANANCDSSNGKISVVGVLNNIGPVTYLWNNFSTSNALSGLAPGTYWVQTTDAFGCVASDTIQVGDDGVPYLSIVSYQSPACFGDSNGSVVLTGTSGSPPYKYSLDGTNFSSTAQLTGIAAGTYTIYITDANSCPNDTLVTFTQPPDLLSAVNPDTVSCFGDATAGLQIWAQGGSPPLLFALNNSPWQSSPVFSGLQAGNYTLLVKDANSCEDTLATQVIGPASPLKIHAQLKDIPCFEENTGYIHIGLTGGWMPYSWNWSHGADSLQLNQLGPLQTVFTVQDARGCQVQDTLEIVQQLCCVMVVPNAFSPNGDSKNDAIHPLAISAVSTMKFSIYNRWGQEVFFSRDPATAWDGTLFGKPCDVGVYHYYLEYTCPFEKEKQVQKGDITLLR